jgi:hypothetical protein
VLLAEHRDEAVQAFVVHDQEAWGPVVPVTGVRVLGRYVLELTFETGEVKMIDLEPDLKGEIFEALRADYSLFCQVRVDPEAATIVWPHGADYSPRTLYAESKPVVPA